ncbi:MAG: hypothetical protein JWN80_26 [Microbacteriaceae bacterium]|nr:hypothetical protein [Microbacteriaceae bacterium]
MSDKSVSDKSVSDKLQAVVDQAHEAYVAGPATVNRKLNQVDKVLGAAVEAIQDLDETNNA